MRTVPTFLFLTALVYGQWTAANRQGPPEMGQVQCYTPGQISEVGNVLTITTAKLTRTCGDTQVDGTVRWPPTAHAYVSGDIMTGNFSFQYGTVTVRAAMPASASGTWPAIWLLNANCWPDQLHTGKSDQDEGACPHPTDLQYGEIDFVECLPWAWWCTSTLWSRGVNQGTQAWTLGDTNYHVFVLTWTPSAITVTMDGASMASWNSNIPTMPMFLLIETQVTSYVADANLPALLKVDYVQIQDAAGDVIFRDDFNHMILPGAVTQ